MVWKNWPSWLKGGIILIIIYALCTLIFLILPANIITFIPQIFGIYVAGKTGQIAFFAEDAHFPYFFTILVNAIFYLIIGIIIGLIIGKIKNRGKK